MTNQSYWTIESKPVKKRVNFFEPTRIYRWPIILAVLSVLFNLIMLFPETGIKMDLNDNVFAFTLIKRMDLTLSSIIKSGNLLNLPLLIDHWTPEWAQGYPVFSFYQHLPSLVIVLLHRLSGLDLLLVFNWFKYLMLSLYPLVIYKSAQKFDFSRESAGICALASTLISTQYLYGTDYNALVFRGSGMYTQLWGIFFLPLALSYMYQTVRYGKSFLWSVIFLCLTLSGHLIFGYIAVLSTPLYIFSTTLNDYLTGEKFFSSFKRSTLRIAAVLTSSFLILSYWLIPLALNQAYQNKSLWDDYTKFNSYGVIQVIKWLVNGQLFDNNRFPIFTILIAMGFFYALYTFFGQKRYKEIKEGTPVSYLLLPLLFVYWLILYFGRYSFGSLFVLPLSDGLHGHRLINGVHIAGIFLIGLFFQKILFDLCGLAWRRKHLPPILTLRPEVIFGFLIVAALAFYPAVKERYEYLAYNKELITYNTALYSLEEKDFEQVSEKLKSLNAHRIYIGRPGNWGRNFQVGGFSAYFLASKNNIPTLGFEPESWSPNTDLEQFFSEYDPTYYNLYNIGYVVAPAEEKFGDAKFLKKIDQYGKFVIYQVTPSPTNFSFINSDTVVYTGIKDRFNLDRFWVGSPLMAAGNHPTVSLKNNIDTTGYSNFLTMNGLNYYQLAKPGTNVGYYNLFGANPFDPQNNLLKFNMATPSGTVFTESFADNLYQATVETPKESLLMLKVTSHPFWKATVDGKKAEIKTVMPFFMAIKIPEGKHEVKFEYYPAWYKNVLLVITLTTPLAYMLGKQFFKK